jgi:hypothetical protein
MAVTKKEKNPAAVALGRLGGLKGGKARAAKLSLFHSPPSDPVSQNSTALRLDADAQRGKGDGRK